ncbi:MAG: hypothetical protein QNJ38_18250 [Prochloraceae cyanobacterium]|nr:hypothetical protein [Prochloraceae cyanobacterium]
MPALAFPGQKQYPIISLIEPKRAILQQCPSYEGRFRVTQVRIYNQKHGSGSNSGGWTRNANEI